MEMKIALVLFLVAALTDRKAIGFIITSVMAGIMLTQSVVVVWFLSVLWAGAVGFGSMVRIMRGKELQIKHWLLVGAAVTMVAHAMHHVPTRESIIEEVFGAKAPVVMLYASNH